MFKPVSRPEFTDTLSFPQDITALPSMEVSRLHGQYTALCAYAMAELAKADVQALKCRSECFVRKNNVARTGQTYGRNKYQTDLQIRLDKHLENLELAAHKAEEQQILLKSYVEIFDKYIASLSREMSRRSSELQSRT